MSSQPLAGTPEKYQVAIDLRGLKPEELLRVYSDLANLLPPKFHKAQDGDSLWKLANKAAVGDQQWDFITAAEERNGINHADPLEVGRVYKLPAMCIAPVDPLAGSWVQCDLKTLPDGQRESSFVSFLFKRADRSISRYRIANATGEDVKKLKDNPIIGQRLVVEGAGLFASISRHNNQPVIDNGGIDDEVMQRISVLQPRRKVKMIVLDSGWPTDAHRKEAYKWLTGVIKRVAREALPEVETMPLWNDLTLEMPKEFVDPQLGDHCLDVMASLTALVKSPGRSAVDVIYLPMCNEQAAQNLLTWIVLLSRMCESEGSLSMVRSKEERDRSLEKLKEEAVSLVKDLAYDRNNKGFFTDRKFITALTQVLSLDSRLSNEPEKERRIISCSWVVRSPLGRMAIPDQEALFIVAAGNARPNTIEYFNVKPNEYEPALRAIDSHDTIAVLNAAENTLDTTSCRLPPESSSAANVVGFDGRTSKGSATSFAAPRLAWYIGAAEAYRIEYSPKKLWLRTVTETLRASRGPEPALQFLARDYFKRMIP